MKLTKSQRRRLSKKFRPNWTQENLLTLAFQNQIKRQLYSKIKGATSVDEIDQIIDEFDIKPLMPILNATANGMFNKSAKEFDLITESFIKNPRLSYLNIRSKSFLPSKKDFHPYLEAYKHNLSLIQNLPRDLAKKLKSAYMKGTSFRGTAFAKELTERLGKRARTIIRTESSKISSTLTQARMQKLGLSAYVWSTSADSRVRGSHALLDGVLFFWNDPPTIDNYQDHCGRFYNCRCIPIPLTRVDDIQFPIKVAEKLNIQTKYIKGGKGKVDTTIVSGSLKKYTRAEFIDKFGHLFV